MPASRQLDPDGNLWDFIAVELRRERTAHGDSLAALGDLWDRDRSAVAHVERGDSKLQEAHAVKLDTRYDTGGRFVRLVRFARQGHDKEWFQAHLELEARATELHIWELQWVPGIVQTEDYIRAVIESAGTRVDIDAEIASRRQRQEKLFGREDPPLTWVMLDQGVVETPVGGAAVQRAQLAALLELAQRPYVTIRVMPRSVGAHVGRDGSFKI
jgi:hypothetical protein